MILKILQSTWNLKYSHEKMSLIGKVFLKLFIPKYVLI